MVVCGPMSILLKSRTTCEIVESTEINHFSLLPGVVGEANPKMVVRLLVFFCFFFLWTR